MHHVRQEDLPFVGSSHEFVGSEHGDTGVSVFLFHGKPGSGPGPHRHPYDEIQFIREGHGTWTVNGKTFEGRAGDIFVIKAGEVHSFKAIGDSPLVQTRHPPQPALYPRESLVASIGAAPLNCGDSDHKTLHRPRVDSLTRPWPAPTHFCGSLHEPPATQATE